MLRTRLWMGTLLIALVGLILFEERWFAPWFPCLFLATSVACLLGVRELVGMLDSASRPSLRVCLAGVLAILFANWHEPLRAAGLLFPIDGWHLIGHLFVLSGLAAFAVEMATFRGPDRIVERISQTLLVVFYLGVLPSFFLQLRWRPEHATLALALTVFVPKCCDIGAFFTGKYLTGGVLGRNHMTPLLSPKKTWQGAVGGLLMAIVTAIAIHSLGPVFKSMMQAVGFGLTVGIAGMLGDLAESLLKRDRQTKDASAAVPGFGGVLDVIDSLLFAAPVAYVWFVWC
ncbi:MAG: phosphatidate cytidylyltransferase [Planctomycetes bacterium]|nr:phosphatidate cytidylyltransferase [Planctomycetota bacterium]